MQRRGIAPGAILSHQQHHPLPRESANATTTTTTQLKDNAIGRHAHLRKSSADTSSGGGTGAVGRKAHGSVASNNNSQQGNLHTIDVEEASSRMGGSGALASIRGKDKEEDDIYEFKSTPKDSSSSSSDEKEGSNGASGGTNRKGDKSGEEKQSAGAHHGSVPPHLVHQDLGGRAGQTHVDGHSHHQASKDHDVKHPQIVGQLNASGGLAVGSNGGREIGTIGASGGIAYVTKRPYSEMVDGGDDIGPPNEDETRRKRRKDVDPLGGIKEASVGPVPLTKSGVGNRGGTPRQEKGAKASGGTPSAKNLGLSAKNALDRKSPCASPKLSGNSSTGVIVGSGDRNTVAGGASGAVAGSIASSGGGGGSSSSSSGKGSSGTSSSNDSDVENGAGVAGGTDDGLGGGKGGEPGFGGVSGGGPKVPPLKIVIPQQSAGGDADTVGTTRNGKNVSTRNHPALPYVVASSNSNESTADKESTSSRSASPADSKSSDEKNPSQASKDERTQQRVLRSSHRGGGGNSNSSLKDGSMDRSNNSSPQMQQQSCGSPSSLSNSGCDTSEKGSSKEASGTSQGSSGNRSNTPNAPGGGGVGEAESGGGTGGASGPNPKSPVVGSASSAGAGSGDGSASGGTGGSNASSSSGGNGGSAGNGSATSGSGNASAPASEKTQGTSSNSSSSSTSSSSSATSETSVHPRKRKIKTNKEQASSGGAAGSSTASGSNATAAGAAGGNAASSSASTSAGSGSGNAASGAAGTAGEDKKDAREETADVHPHDQPITNCYQMYLKIRKQIESRQKGLFPVQPKPPQGFKDYLMNRCTYVLAGKAPPEPNIQVPASLPPALKDLFQTQEKERHKLKMQHIVEKEKLVLAVEQEILRVHGRAARALANQSLPFSVCTILKDEEVYNIITPEQEEKDRNARSRYNGRLFLSWLQDVDDKWEKIKEAMLLRHHNEAESLHAVQRMDWEFNMKEHALCEFKAKPVIDDTYVPMVNVNDDFDLLPA